VLVAAFAFTTSDTALDTLARLLAFPAYLAVNDRLPTAAKEVFRVAIPALTTAVPRAVAPSLNVTVPVGLLPVTVALSTTDPPTAAGFGVAVNVVFVAACVAAFTDRVSALELLVKLFESPL
jgi:hypothetical protein